MPVEGILLIDLPNDDNIVPGENFQSHGPKMIRPSTNHNGFTLLPTDPPPTPPRIAPPKPPPPPPNRMVYGAPVSGQPPQYHSVPDDLPKRQAPQYQEIPYGTNGHPQLPPPARQTSLSQQSDTEVDQALQYGPPRSASTAPLTELPPPPPGERRPRKKANPLYDGFNNEVVTTQSSSTKKSPVPAKNSCGRRSFRCIKHPVTICLIILVVVVNFVALLLLFTGTVEQVSAGSRQKLVQTTPVTPVTALPDQAEMLEIIRAQGDTIARLEARIISLESLLMTNTTENATTTAKIAQNSVQIEQLAVQVTALTENTSTQIADLRSSLAVTDTKANTNIQITSDLQATVEALRTNTSRIDDQLNTLTAMSETSAQDITRIKDKNDLQDQNIIQLQSRISVVRQEFGFQLTEYNHTIYEDLAAISKMQGPPGVNGSRGADGVSNLAGCRYKMISETSSFTRVTSVPPISVSQGFTVTGATCSTYDGTSANLVDEGGLICKCDGRVDSPTGSVRYCYLHYWECPTE